MKHINDLIKQYGSQQRLADAMGVHRPQVSRWVKLNAQIDENGDVYIKTRSVKPVDGITNKWKEIAAKALAVLQVNGIPLTGDYPERCLNEIRAEAVEKVAVYICERSFKEALFKSEIVLYASEYAAEVRKGGE